VSRRLALILLVAAAGALGVFAYTYAVGRANPPTPHAAALKAPARAARHVAVRLVERITGRLTEALQNPAAAVTPGDALVLLGGLTAADTSTSSIVLAHPSNASQRGQLPTALHDAGAAQLGAFTYLFGGGDGVRQLDAIVRVDGATGATAPAGRLPSPSSDQAAAAVGGTAYVVGGYTGTRWLDTIVAWRPGKAARVVAHLPTALRYAAVTAVGDRLLIAGGSLPDGTASSDVFEFVPALRRVVRIGRLPAPTTHAAAAAVGNVAYVLGGRGATLESKTSRIVGIDLRTRRIWSAGHLSRPRSDLVAATLGSRIVLAGGRGPAGTEDRIS